MDPVPCAEALLAAAEPVAGDEALAALLGAALAGGVEALEGLYRAMAADLWAFALWRGGDPEVASEAVQKVFCRIAGARGAKERIRSPRAWLFTAVRRAVVDQARRRRRAEELDAQLLVASDDDPERRAEAAAVSRRLARLPPRLREAVYLRHFADLSFREIAAIAGVPTFTAASRYRRGIEKLRRELQRGAR